MPNEFGALKIRHQPLAKASGMKSFGTLSNRTAKFVEMCQLWMGEVCYAFECRLGF